MHVGIAISGKAGAGKNAFARVVAEQLAQHGQWGAEFNFADELKRELWEVHGLRKEDPGGREKLVWLGHGRREEYPDYWVERLARRVTDVLPYGVVPIITDCRYLNELSWARRFGFVTVRIDSTALDRSAVLHARGEDAVFAYSEHASETELDEEWFHLRFWNPHSTVAPLHEAAFYAVELLLGEVEIAA